MNAVFSLVWVYPLSLVKRTTLPLQREKVPEHRNTSLCIGWLMVIFSFPGFWILFYWKGICNRNNLYHGKTLKLGWLALMWETPKPWQREISITKRWRGPSVSKGHTSKVLGPWTNSLGSKSHASMRKIIPSLTIDFYSPGNEVTKREIFRLVIQGVRGFFSISEGKVQLLEIK